MPRLPKNLQLREAYWAAEGMRLAMSDFQKHLIKLKLTNPATVNEVDTLLGLLRQLHDRVRALERRCK